MPSKGIIVVHAQEDEGLKDSVMEHLGVLDHITKLDAIVLEDLDCLGTVALRNKLKGREALVVLLSAQVLSSKFLRHSTVQALAGEGKLVLLSGRQCAWRIIPWLRHCDIWPETGSVGHLAGVERDQTLTELTYDLAGRISDEYENIIRDESASITDEDIEDSEVNDVAVELPSETTSTVDYPAAPDLVPEIAAGPAREATDSPIEDDSNADEMTRQFDATCVSVFPEGAQLDDDVLGALLELGLISGASCEDDGDMVGARRAYLHAACRLVELVNRSLTDGQPISTFIRQARLSMWRLLKDAEGGDANVDELRGNFEDALSSVAS
ncbi:MAG: hypothetical protein ACI97A_001791 [Planctomycetota bacterium]|jgi:hypothetical protein